MIEPYRRGLGAVVGALLLAGSAMAAALPAPSSVRSFDHAGQVYELRCQDTGSRSDAPAVLLLHGMGGYERFVPAYESYLRLLAARGWRACALGYYSPEDLRVMQGGDAAARRAHREQRFAVWLAAGRAALQALDPEGRRRLGVLGFSQGAYLAVALAGSETRVAALAAFYGGVPQWGALPELPALPPTLIVHGEADSVVPFAEALALQRFAQPRSPRVLLRRHAGAEHGFDFDFEPDAPPAARAARRQMLDFFSESLKTRRAP